jgi:hypothetical protein
MKGWSLHETETFGILQITDPNLPSGHSFWKTAKFYLEEVSGPVLVADIGKGLERRQERGMLPHLRTSDHCFT